MDCDKHTKSLKNNDLLASRTKWLKILFGLDKCEDRLIGLDHIYNSESARLGGKGSQSPGTSYRTSIDDYIGRIGSTGSQLDCGLSEPRSSADNDISEFIAR